MLPPINKIKGIHPGVILERELKIKKLKGVELARSINEYPQTLNAIMKGRRGVNSKLSIKLGHYFDVVADYFMLLQASYDVKVEMESDKKYGKELTKKLRKAHFWDTDFSDIDWDKNRRSVIKRIFERGNEKEIKAVISFYGKDTVNQEIANAGHSFIPAYAVNIKKYLPSQIES